MDLYFWFPFLRPAVPNLLACGNPYLSGIGVRTAARILLEVGNGSAFKSAGPLAAYAGIGPVTHRSGSSIRGEHSCRPDCLARRRCDVFYARLQDKALDQPSLTAAACRKLLGHPR